MPSRRQVLSAAGLVGAAGLSGCLTRLGIAERGYLSYKGVSVTWRSDGRPVSADLCWAWSDGHGRIFGWIAEEYPTIAASPLDIRLTKETSERLVANFEDVSLKLGFSRPNVTDHELLEGDWPIAETSRRHFNRIQFGDQAEFIFRFPRIRLVNVYTGTQGDPDEWDHELQWMNFSEMYRDRDVPIASSEGEREEHSGGNQKS